MSARLVGFLKPRALKVLRSMADGRGILVTWRDGKHVISGPAIEDLTSLVCAGLVRQDSEVLTAWQKERGAVGYAVTAAGREVAAKSGGYSPPRLSPEQAAEHKVSDAAHKLIEALEREIFPKLKTNLGLRLMFKLLQESSAWAAHAEWDRARRVKGLQSPALASAIELLGKPSWENALKLADDREFTAYSIHLGGMVQHPECWPVLQRLAKVLKLELAERPKAADFLAPTAKAEKAK